MKQLNSYLVQLYAAEREPISVKGDVVLVRRVNDRFVEIITIEGEGVEPESVASPKAPSSPAPKRKPRAKTKSS